MSWSMVLAGIISFIPLIYLDSLNQDWAIIYSNFFVLIAIGLTIVIKIIREILSDMKQ